MPVSWRRLVRRPWSRVTKQDGSNTVARRMPIARRQALLTSTPPDNIRERNWLSVQRRLWTRDYSPQPVENIGLVPQYFALALDRSRRRNCGWWCRSWRGTGSRPMCRARPEPVRVALRLRSQVQGSSRSPLGECPVLHIAKPRPLGSRQNENRVGPRRWREPNDLGERLGEQSSGLGTGYGAQAKTGSESS